MARIAPFVPSKDLATSIAFYEALGFTRQHVDESIAVMDYEGATILVQPYWVEEWAGNWMAQLQVANLDAWWTRAEAALAGRFAPGVMKPPSMQPWGLRVAFLSDPAGALWHVSGEDAA
ncbi:MAG: glyoxalase [Porphyrobacter sp.]|nr:glyoxalase [Porphyrobacter sp.]